MAFPPQFLDELRARLSLPEVIGRRVRLVRRGREYQGLCPFHNEKTPSFTVNEDKGFFHCFGCGAHGDVIGFEMRAANLAFPEAVERLAAEAGLEVPRPDPQAREKARRQTTLAEANEAACRWFEAALRAPQGRDALAYLKGRGLADETIARFRLGYAPASREALKRALTAQNIPEGVLVEAGLLIKPDSGNPYDRFRGRVIFPITDRRGRVIGFGGRVLDDGQPKYLNSPDTPLFHKREVLYGLAQARQPARETGLLVAVEGYMDVIALAQGGLPGAVAPLGTALTERQIEEMWRLAPEPVLCFDGDAAGGRAAARAAERALPLLKPGHSLRFAMLPPGDDPDSLVRSRGAGAVRAVLEAASPLSEMLWRRLTEGHRLDTPERVAGLEREMRQAVAAIADASVRQHYERALRERLWQALKARRPRAQVRAHRGAAPPAAGDMRYRGPDGRLRGAQAPVRPATAAAARREGLLLGLILRHPWLLDEVGEPLGEMAFGDAELDNLRQEVLKHLGNCASLDSAEWRDHLLSCGFGGAVHRALDSGIGSSLGKSTASRATVLAAWGDIHRRHQEVERRREGREAVEDFAQEPTVRSYRRILALTDVNESPVAGDEEWSRAPGPEADD